MPNDILERARAILAANGRGPDAVPDAVEGDVSGDARRVLADNGRHGAEQDFADIQLSDAMMNILGSPAAKSLPDLEAFRESAERSRKFEEQARRGFKRMIHKMANPPPSRGEKLLNAGNAFFRGIGSMGSSVPKDMALAAKSAASRLPNTLPKINDTDVQDLMAYKIGRTIDDFFQTQFPQDPRLRNDLIAETIPHGLGSVAAFFLGGGAGKLIGGAAGRALATFGLGAASGSVESFERAKGSGKATDEEALRASEFGNLVGIVDAIPALRIMNRFNKASGGVLGKAVKRSIGNRVARQMGSDAVFEGVTEGLQAIGSNKIAQIYDAEQPAIDALVFEATFVGGIVGGLASGVAHGVGAINARQLARSLRQTDPREAVRLEANKVPSRRDVAGTPAAELKSVRERRAFADELREPKLATGEKTLPLGTEQQQQEAETAAEKPVVRTPAETSGFVSLDDVSKKIGRGLKGALSFRKRFFTKEGHLPNEAFAAKVARDGEINSQLQQVRNTLKDYDKAVKKVYGSLSQMADEDVLAVNRVLQGEQGVDTLPEPLREHVIAERNEIDALSRRLIDLGVIEGDLVAVVDKNIGHYTNRSYRVFDDPKWSENVPEETRNIAKAFIRAEHPELTEDQLEGRIKNLLFEGKAADSPIAMISRGEKLGSKDLSILKRRQGIPVEIRELFGEYHDPRINYARSASKMAHLIANHRMLTTIRNEGMGQFLFEKSVSNEQGDFIKKIAVEESNVMAPLNGLYTTPDIEAAFRRAVKPEERPWYLRHYMKVNSVVKFSKTIGSQMTHVRNLTGNLGFATASGHFRFWKAPESARLVATSMGLNNDESYRQRFRRLQELGVVGDSARAGELREVLQDSLGKDPGQFIDDTAGKYAKKAVKGLITLYRVEDDVWKIYAHANDVERYGKAFPELTAEALDELAAQIIRNTYPTYSNVPEAIQMLRRFPLVGTFTSFPWEVGRTAYHQIRLIKKDLSDPRTRNIGYQRLAGSLVAAFGTYAVATASRFLVGMTRDEDEDVRQLSAPWSKNSQFLHLGTGDNGRPRTIDMSYTDPYEYLKKPIMAFMRGEDWEGRIFDAVVEASEPFLSEEILAEKLLDIARNSRKESGSPVFNEEAPFLDRLNEQLSYIFEALEPGTVTSARRIWNGIIGKVTPYGRSYDPVLEGLAVMTGARIQELDVPQSLSFASSHFKRRLTRTTRILTSVVNRRGTVTDEEIAMAYESVDAARRRLYEEMSRKALAAERLGVGRREMIRIMRAAGMSKKDVNLVLSESYQPYRPSSSFLATQIKRVRVLPGDEGSADKKEFIRRRTLVSELSGR